MLVTAVFCGIAKKSSYAAVPVEGRLEAGSAVGINDGSIYRNYLQADVDIRKAFDNTEFRILMRGEHDSVRPVDASDYQRLNDNAQSRFYLREAYISQDFFFDSVESLNFKIGRMIHTWGNSDEIKPVDILNPQDYSNFIYTPVQERKYGVFSASTGLYITEDIFIEGIIIPEFSPTETGSGAFELGELQALKTLDADGVDEERPAADMKEISYAVRAGASIFDVDMHVNYFYGNDYYPTYQVKAVAPSVQIEKEYKQIQMIGFDFQRALFSGIAVRGELAYFYEGRFHFFDINRANYLDPTSAFVGDVLAGGKGNTEKDMIKYTAGFDVTDLFIKDLYLNVQFCQDVILDYDDSLEEDELKNQLTWVFEYKFLNQKARTKMRGYYDISKASAAVNLEAGYKFSDNFEFSLGYWMIEGKDDSMVGQFDENDFVYLSAEIIY